MSRATGRLTLLHVSDVHATADGLLYGRVDGRARLEAVGAYARHAGITPEAIVVTGDLIERGHTRAYADLRDAFSRLEDDTGAPVLTVLGNHDDGDAAGILRGHDAGHERVVIVGDLRIILLDSSAGSLTADGLSMLRRTIEQPHGWGSVVALHHPPVASPLPALAKAGLRNGAALMGAVAHTDVRAILAGHFHHPLTALASGVPVFVGPSLAYHQVMNAGPERVSGHDSAMFSLVRLAPDEITATTVSLTTPAPIFSAPLADSKR